MKHLFSITSKIDWSDIEKIINITRYCKRQFVLCKVVINLEYIERHFKNTNKKTPNWEFKLMHIEFLLVNI